MSEPWIQTHSGRRFYPLNPSHDDVYIGDIAHALANLCRFTGHCCRFYSIAEHSVLVSRHCPPEYKLEGLLHDAAEAYFSDIAHPVKYALPELLAIDERIHQAVASAFGLPDIVSLQVKDIDTRILADERERLMPRSQASEWFPDGEPDHLGVDIQCLEPYAAEVQFVMEYEKLMEAR